MQSKKILGLDLGVASIGWAFIKEYVNQKPEIVDMGVRVIPATKDESSVFLDFEKGKPASFSKERTTKRGIRRNNFRWKLRRDRLIKILKEHKMFDAQTLEQEQPHEIWELRAKAVTEQISLVELGRVLLHINQKRGFKSNRKANTAEDEGTEFKQALSSNMQILEERNQTIGQYLFEELSKTPSFSSKNKTFSRSGHIDEFERIWETQAKYHSALTEDLKNEIGERTIFYQRPLKSAKHLLSNCRFEKHHKVIARSSPLFQYFRSFELVLNLRFTDSLGTDRPLTNEEMKLLLQHLTVPNLKSSMLDKKHDLTEAKIRKLIDGLGKEYECSHSKIEGCRTLRAIHLVLEEHGVDSEQWIDFNPLAEKPDEQKSYQLWHCLYSIESPEDLRRTLCEKFGFDITTANALMRIKLEDDYGSLSSRAIKRILKAFNEFPENAAHGVLMAGYKSSDSETQEERATRELLDQLPHLKKGELRNPVVEKVLNQLITLVNEIIASDEFGRPHEIRIELARDLKSGAKERKRKEQAINKARKENEEIRDILSKEFGIKRPSRQDIFRHRCWIEQKHQCLYSGDPIPRSKLFSDAEYDLDHIIPRARMYDDSFANRVLVKTSENRTKSDATAFDFMSGKGDSKLNEYKVRVKSLYDEGTGRKSGELQKPGIGRAKRDFLLMPANEIPQDFIDRQLRESQYIVKAAMKLLKQVCREVTPTAGKITDLLRHQWGLTDLLKEMQIPKYREWGLTETVDGQERIKDWSKRLDHRHHAVDALVVACTTRSFIQKLNTLNALYEDDDPTVRLSIRNIEEPWAGFRKDAKEATEAILVSFRNRRRVATWSKNRIKQRGGKSHKQRVLVPRGFLHLETVYGERLVDRGRILKINKRLTRSDAELIINRKVREAIINRLSKFNNDSEAAFKNIKKAPLYIDEKRIDEVRVYDRIFVYRQNLNDQFKKTNAIVDPEIRAVVEAHLQAHGNDAKKAFGNLEENPVWYNKSKGIQIRSVNVQQKAEDLVPVRTKEDGTPKDFVFTRNNHHIAFFIDEKGKAYDEVITFWDAYERKRQGLSEYPEKSSKGDRKVFHLKINDLVLIDLNPNEADFQSKKGRQEVSKHLFRVQKLASGDVSFRHHLETTLDNKRTEVRITSAKMMVERIHPVRHDILGRLQA